MNRLLILLIILYLSTRLINLTVLPIFTDESIYIYWAKLIVTTHTQWFISLTDGKPPLLIWLISLAVTILPAKSYLLAGRLISVIAGLIALVGTYKLTETVFKSRLASVTAGIFYIASPFILLYDRMALFDSLLSAMLVWAVYLALEGRALAAGIFLGLAFLSKPTAIVFVFLIPAVVTLWRKKLTVVPLLISLAIGLGIDNLQRVSHVYYLMAQKNSQFLQPLTQLLADPFSLLAHNSKLFFDWIVSYYTWPLLILGIVALVFLMTKDWRKGLIFLLLWAVPIALFTIVGREIFPRYILFTTIYFLIPLAYFLSTLSRPIFLLGIFLLLLPLVRFDYFLLVNPAQAPLPATDYSQYVSEHPSGYGLDQTFSFLNQKRQSGPLSIVTQGTFGLYPYAFNLEYWGQKDIQIIPRWPLSVIDQDIYDAQKTSQVFVILKEHQTIPENLPLVLVLQANKPGGKYPILVTRLKNP